MVQTNTRRVTMYVKYNCTIMSAVWCYTVDVCQQCIHVKDLRIKLPLISFERTGAGKPRPTTFQTRRKKRRKIETLRLNPNVLIFLIFADLLSKTKSVQTHCALQGRTRFDDTVQMWISTIFKFKHLLTLILKKIMVISQSSLLQSECAWLQPPITFNADPFCLLSRVVKTRVHPEHSSALQSFLMSRHLDSA